MIKLINSYWIKHSIVLPSVGTAAITDITTDSATTGGNVSGSYIGTISARGVCYNTAGDPTLEDDFTEDGTGTGVFISSLIDLDPDTTYYVRAYATNEAGTSYGEEETFDTESAVVTSNIKYGRLYNWYAVGNPLFAPVGWHVPTYDDLVTNFLLLNDPSAGGKVKETGLTYWNTPNTGATNELQYNLRAGGYRDYYDGSFNQLNATANIWTTSQYSGVDEKYRAVFSYDSAAFTTSAYPRKMGHSVRLIKDDSTNPGTLTDLDGNVYRTVKIGTQVWLADNWACTQLNDTTPILNVTVNATWAALTSLAYCNYANDIANVFITPPS